MMTAEKRQQILEALMFATDVPLTFTRIKELIGDVTVEEFAADVEALERTYRETGRAFGIIRVSGGVQLGSKPEYAPWIRQLLRDRLSSRLSRAALEVLAIIAYRQPVQKPEIERIRGVDSGAVIGTLMERGLITIGGRATTPGRPLLYITTQDFLRYFGLNALDDLPKLSELRSLVETDSKQESIAFDRASA
ncbi:MAG: SMC-Scp complex subunit ScpB, partial [bacterium]